MASYSKKDTNIIVSKLYPFIAKAMDKNGKKFKNNMSDWFNRKSSQLYEAAPYENILFSKSDTDTIFTSLGITEKEVDDIMQDCFYWNIPYNPGAAKEPYIVVLMCIIKYYLKQGDRKNAELTGIYLAFSGKIYASVYTVIFPKVNPGKYRSVMDYAINNMMDMNFGIKKYGSMFEAIRNLVITWIDHNIDTFKRSDSDDDDFGKSIQDIRDRVRSFLYNINSIYMQAYENKAYLNYESDNLSDGAEFHISDNDSLKATKYTEASVTYLTSNSVSLNICNKCADSNIKPTEIKGIMEMILYDKNNLPNIYRVVNIMICDFLRYNPTKSVGSVDFITHNIRMKPNTRDKYIIELKDIILSWLNQDANYRRRKSRAATANSYYKAILMYFAFAISYATNKL